MIMQIGIIVVVLVALAIRASQRPRNFPPGPTGLPFLGYTPFLGRWTHSHLGMEELAQQFGPVVGFYHGTNQPVISVCGYEAVREALLNESFNSRPFTPALKERTNGKVTGLVFTEGELFMEQRRFTLRHLRDVGHLKTSMEDIILSEVRDLLRDLRAQSESDPHRLVDFRHLFNVPVVNTLWALVADKRYERDDPEMIQLLASLEVMFRGGNTVAGSAPVPNYVFHLFPGLKKCFGIDLNVWQDIQDFIEATVAQHKKDRVADAPRDLIDIYLNEMTRTADPTFNHDQLVGIIMDLFSAGSDSTSNSIGFALLHLIHHPEVQQKMQSELDAVCGSALPTLAHRSQLPFTEAVLMEAQRMSAVAPLTVPHYAAKDARLRGYYIPKGSIININIHSVHHDPNHWLDPEHFKPDRHLDKEGKLVKTDHFMPFGLGKRCCLGEPLACDTYFLFVTAIVKCFELRPEMGQNGPTLPSLDPVAGFTLGYTGFKAALHARD